jgi:glycine oxidase
MANERLAAMVNAAPYDYAIIGQGLAGTLLAWRLHQRGRRVVVIDRDEAVTASKVAAGLINPITGQRTCLSWRLQEFLPVAIAFYRTVERELNTPLLHSMPLVRLLPDAKALQKWQSAVNDPEIQSFLSDPQPTPLVDPARIRMPEDGGGFEIAAAHILDVPRFLQASRTRFEVRTADIDIASAVTVETDGVRIDTGDGTVFADRLVFCQGPDGRSGNPFFDWVPFACAKGELLTIDCHAMEDETRILNGPAWMAPTPGATATARTFRAGSTYARDDLTQTPTAAGRAAIEEKLRQMLKVDFTVTCHTAAIRPIIAYSRALIGMHPTHSRIGFFNGLGSKGSLNGPLIAERLAAHLEDGEPLEHEFDLLKNS